MTNLLPIPTEFRKAGLDVEVITGWETRHRPGAFSPPGVLNHHTGSSAFGWSLAQERAYAVWMFTVGRSDLSAPLVQIALGRSGRLYVGAAGRANHAGTARASGSVASGDGNALYIGIEWMLSGTEAIPANMLQVGITANAVLTEMITRTSVETISCHYNTSVTGKWDIGDPNGIEYRGHRVLDTVKFRTAVAARRADLYHSDDIDPVTPGEFIDLTVAHASMQYSDTTKMWEHDVSVITQRNYAWITGTEAGEDYNWVVLKRVAEENGYRIVRFRSNWVAVDKDIIKRGSFRFKGVVVAKAAQVSGPGHDTAYVQVTFKHKVKGVGKISVVGSHAPTHGRKGDTRPGYTKNVKWTEMIGRTVASTMMALGKGADLAFMGMDSNQIDKTTDIFHTRKGTKPVAITSWDEMHKWPDTGHGNIDVIARLIKDARVRCIGTRAYNDKSLFLYSDHNLTQAKYRITLMKGKKA